MNSKKGSNVDFPRRGRVYKVAFDPARGAEIKKTRPAVVVSSDVMNELSHTVLIMPITSGRYQYLIRVPLQEREGGTSKASVIATDQIRAIDKSRIKEYIGKVTGTTMAQVEDAIRDHFDLPVRNILS